MEFDEENHLSYNNQQAVTAQFIEVALKEKTGLRSGKEYLLKDMDLEDNQSLKFT